MNIEFTELALFDLSIIKNHIEAEDPAAALRVLTRIRQTIHHLKTFPEIGRPWEAGPTRALSIAGIPYRIHYRVIEDRLQILRVYHTSRMPPEIE